MRRRDFIALMDLPSSEAERHLRTSCEKSGGPLDQPIGCHRADRVGRGHVEPIDCSLDQGRLEAKRYRAAEQPARRQDRSHEDQLPNLHAQIKNRSAMGIA